MARNTLSWVCLVMLTLLTSCSSQSDDSGVSESYIKSLGVEAAAGDLEAIDKLEEVYIKLAEDYQETGDHKLVMKAGGFMGQAFRVIGQSAVEGSQSALDALKYGMINKQFSNNFAAPTFGYAVAAGNKEALAMLINYRQHGFSRATTAIAFLEAAKKNVPEAVQFMIDMLNDPAAEGVWYKASGALVQAAYHGNEDARVALDKYVEQGGRLPSLHEL